MQKLTKENTKILFAPHEIGGQMQLMAEELRRRGYFATAATYNQEAVGHVNDINMNLSKLGNPFGKHYRAALFTLWAAHNYDIFHFFWGESLYGNRLLHKIDLPLLRRLGKKIFVHFRGIDIVDLAYFDYLRAKTAGDPVSEPPMSRPDQLRSVKAWQRYSDKMLVSEPDLLWVVPEALMIQQAVDLSRWQTSHTRPLSETDGIIRIAHAPTMRRKKGTEFVEQAVHELKQAGHPVELVLIEKVPFHQVKSFYEQCDIGVDQVLYGWYGKVSIELMLMGRPVLCYINDQLHSHRPDMPIVNANPHNLAEKLLELVQNAKMRHELGQRGIEYVRKYHDVRSIVDQCLELYGIE